MGRKVLRTPVTDINPSINQNFSGMRGGALQRESGERLLCQWWSGVMWLTQGPCKINTNSFKQAGFQCIHCDGLRAT